MNSKRHKLTLSIKLLSLTHSPGVASLLCVRPHGHLDAWGPQEPRGFCAEEGEQGGEGCQGGVPPGSGRRGSALHLQRVGSP